MGRSVTRYALLAMFDAFGDASTPSKVCKRAERLLGRSPGEFASSNSIDNLLKETHRPGGDTRHDVFEALNRSLADQSLEGVRPSVVAELNQFDDRASFETGDARLELFRTEMQMRQTKVNAQERPIDRLFIGLIGVIAGFELVDSLWTENQRDLAQARRAEEVARQASRDRQEALRIGLAALATCLAELDKVASAYAPKRFGSLRFYLALSQQITSAMLLPPWERIGNPEIADRWQDFDPNAGWKAVQPVARITRLLRQMIEMAQYAQQPTQVINFWVLLKEKDHRFDEAPDPLEYRPRRTWGQNRAVGRDAYLCCASRLLARFEKELPPTSTKAERHLRRTSEAIELARELAIDENALVPCGGSCKRRSELLLRL